MLRAAYRMLAGLLLAVVAAAVLLLTLMATGPGSRWLVQRGAALLGDAVRVQRVEGALLTRFTLRGLEYRGAGQHLQADVLEIAWRPAALLAGTLHLRRLAADGVRIEVSAPGGGAAPAAAPQIRLPLAVRVDEARITDLTLGLGDSARQVQRLALSADAGATEITLRRVRLDMAPLHLEAQGRLRYAPPLGGGIRVHWHAEPQPGLQAEGEGRLRGDADGIEIEHRLTAPFVLRTHGTLRPWGEAPQLDLAGDWEALGWPLRGGPAAYRSPAGSYTVSGPLAAPRVTAEARLAAPALAIAEAGATLTGTLQLQPAPAFEGELRWTATLPDGTPAAGGGHLAGDAAAVRLDHELSAPFTLSTHGEIRGLQGSRPQLALAGKWHDLRWPLTGEAAVRSAAGEYRLEGEPADAHLTLQGALAAAGIAVPRLEAELSGGLRSAPGATFGARLHWRARPAAGPPLAGSGSLQGDATTLHVEHRLESPFTLTASGRLTRADGSLRAELEGRWQGLRWPLEGAARYRSEAGRYRLQGTPGDYSVEISGELQAPELPPARVRIEGRGDGTGLRLREAALEAGGSRLTARGEVGWAPQPRWDLELSGKGVNPALWRPDLPGRLDLQAHTRGSLAAGEPSVEVTVRRLQGTLRDRTLQGEGELGLAGGRLHARQFRLRSGENHLEIDGTTTGERVAAHFEVDAPSLGGLWPGLRGSLRGSGRIEGASDDPRVQARLQAQRLSFGGYGAARLEADLDLDPADAAASASTLEARGVELPERSLERVRVQARGNLGRHDLTLELHSAWGALAAAAHGAWDGRHWQGELRSARLQPAGEAAAAGVWQLSAPVSASATADAAELAQACWVHGESRLCARLSWSRGAGLESRAELHGLPLALAQPYLPEGVELQGRVDGELRAGDRGAGLEARAELVPQPGSLTYRSAGGDTLRAEYHDALLRAIYRDDSLQAEFRLGLAPGGSARGRVVLGAAPAAGPRSLQGRVEARLPDVGPLAAFLPRVSDAGGAVELDSELGGTLEAPTVEGRAELREGRAMLPELGLELTGIRLTARNDGSERVKFSGRFDSGAGEARLEGEVALDPAAGWPLHLSLRGEGVQVAKLPEAEILASPDLELRMAGERVQVSGRVRVPRARIHLKELPEDAVSVSPDEIIVDDSGEPVAPSGPGGPAVSARVEMILGDDVQFEGFGLSARLSGSLQTRTRPGQPPTAEGTLALVDGRYRAYGQRLTIERGRLLFSGPLQNPALDVRATRKAGSVTAGLEISGTLREPHSRVFSEPPMSEADALSYLLTGHALAGASQSEGSLLAQAALSMGLERSQLITRQIGQTLGLDELTVGSEGGTEQSALMMGKYLTPDLYVRYALGLFDTVGSLQLNYRLTDSLSLEAQSGERGQGMDIIYSIERDDLF